MIFRATVLTPLPRVVPGTVGGEPSGKALAEGLWSLDVHDIRDAASDRHRSVDDTLAGGGPGMAMRADAPAAAIDAASPADDERPRLLMSPRGRRLDQRWPGFLPQVRAWSSFAGRFEGVDERVIEGRNLHEVSIGDYVLAGGEVAAMALLEAVVRLLPGVMGNAESAASESFVGGLLEYPQYTRPQTWEGRAIPDVLTSGDHGKIAEWRRRQALTATRERRPDLLPGADKRKD